MEISRLEFGKEIIKLADKYDFTVLNADTKCCSLENFGKLYPDRCFSFGIAEQNLFAAASGVANAGEKVIVSTFAVFASMRACEQVRTFICYPNLNVTIIATHGGLLTGEDGATHIASEDIAIMRSFANMTIVEPSDVVAARSLAEEAIRFRGPLYIRFPKAATPTIHAEDFKMEIGKAYKLKEYGNECGIIATGAMTYKALEAAEQLALEGVKVQVLEVPTIKPLDEKAVLDIAKKTGRIVTVEDHTIIGGLGSAVCETLSENYPVPVKRLGIRDVFGESGDPQKQYDKNEMNVKHIVSAVKSLLK